MLRTYLFGSFLKIPETANDIDLAITVETVDDVLNALYTCADLGTRLGKPVDVFFNPVDDELCEGAYYDPETGKWGFTQKYAGQHFFDDCIEVDLDSIQPENAPLRPNLNLMPKPGREVAA